MIASAPATLLHRPLWLGAMALLLLPAVAMQFTAEVRWGAEDFAAMAALLSAGGLLVEAARRIGRRPLRRAAFAGVGLAFLTVWGVLATAG